MRTHQPRPNNTIFLMLENQFTKCSLSMMLAVCSFHPFPYHFQQYPFTSGKKDNNTGRILFHLSVLLSPFYVWFYCNIGLAVATVVFHFGCAWFKKKMIALCTHLNSSNIKRWTRPYSTNKNDSTTSDKLIRKCWVNNLTWFIFFFQILDEI